ncbi:MAG: hypothetical protein HYV18_09470 [Gammaproteobacteria bacterium]|nr:hypothetical protein [Gammaproteobacteria bacterium]
MERNSVSIREFRAKLADYVMHSDQPIAITRHGSTVGYFIPTKPDSAEADRLALRKAAAAIDAMLGATGFTEQDLDDVVREFQTARKKKRA